MRTQLLAAVASAAFGLAMAGPASADIVFCNGGGCASQGETVHLDTDDGSAGSDGGANTVIGNLQSGLVDVLISSNEAIHTTSDGFGQAWIVANDFTGADPPTTTLDSGGLKTMTFSLEPGWFFETLEFRLTPSDTTATGPTPDWTINLTGINSEGQVYTDSFSGLGTNEFFNGVAINGQSISSVSFTTSGEIAKVAQVRIGGFEQGVVPEPATWALMILGFGGAGAMIRRRRAVLA